MGVDIIAGGHSQYNPTMRCATGNSHVCTSHGVTLPMEGLPPKETIRDYRTIHIPAHEVHFQRDNPKGAATLIVNNDARLGPFSWPK